MYADCRHCGMKNCWGSAVCWNCRCDFEPAPLEQSKPRRDWTPRFSLQTLMMTVTLFAVCFATFRAFLPLGVLVAVAVIPSGLSIAIATMRYRAEGRTIPLGEKIGIFAAVSIPTVVFEVVGAVLGGGIGLFVAIFVAWDPVVLLGCITGLLIGALCAVKLAVAMGARFLM
jgi:hypothetical protein